jgi:hypothetical protein
MYFKETVSKAAAISGVPNAFAASPPALAQATLRNILNGLKLTEHWL